MRLAAAIAINLLILAGLALYLGGTLAEPPPRIGLKEPPPAAGRFFLEITASFAAEGDAFALDAAAAGGGPALAVQLAGREVLAVEKLAAGTPVRSPLAGLSVGRNELFVQCHPAGDQLAQAQALRVRVLREDVPVAEQTLWSEPGGPVGGTVVVEIPAEVVDDHAP